MMTGGRKDHWFLIMFGGVGPDSVGLPCIMSSANLENSCIQSFIHSLGMCLPQESGMYSLEQLYAILFRQQALRDAATAVVGSTSTVESLWSTASAPSCGCKCREAVTAL